jgi:Xaa-Pro dipeptidase
MSATPGMPDPAALFGDRQNRLRLLLAEAALDAVALVPGPNLSYFSGATFHLSERPVLGLFPVRGKPIFLVPVLEAMKVEALPFPTTVFSYDDEAGPAAACAQALGALQSRLQEARREGVYRPERAADTEGDLWLGVEGRRIRYLELERMGQTPSHPRVFDADVMFAEQRMRKDDAELAAMRRAVAVAQAALDATLPMLRAGVTEKAVAAELTLQLLRQGSDPNLPFSPIVAAGANGASPHAFPSDKVLAPGELVIVDWGACVDGYFSDLTRTFALGGAPLDPRLAEAYRAVRDANAAARAAVRPGATGADVDLAARAVIQAAGLGERFLHRTGHGLGLEVHEEPDMKAGATTPRLAVGMTFTIEPGVYLPGLGGVRIEDDMVVVPGGGESLSDWDRELMVLD